MIKKIFSVFLVLLSMACNGSGENGVSNVNSGDLSTIALGDPQNRPPVVDAGLDQYIGSYSTNVSGSATDDGLPFPALLTYTWSMESGPAPVIFGNPSATSTSVSFSSAGTYYLKLTASDGELTGSHIIIVRVQLRSAPIDSTKCNVGLSSLTVPASVTYANVGNFTISWKYSGICNARILVESGNYSYNYVPTRGKGSFTPNMPAGVAQTESSVHVSLITGAANAAISITKNIAITDTPLAPTANQCEITSLTATPVAGSGGKTVLRWTSPKRCSVLINQLTPSTYNSNNYVGGFLPGKGSITVNVSAEPTTFYVTSKTGANQFDAISWASTVDVPRQ